MKRGSLGLYGLLVGGGAALVASGFFVFGQKREIEVYDVTVKVVNSTSFAQAVQVSYDTGSAQKQGMWVKLPWKMKFKAQSGQKLSFDVVNLSVPGEWLIKVNIVGKKIGALPDEQSQSDTEGGGVASWEKVLP